MAKKRKKLTEAEARKVMKSIVMNQTDAEIDELCKVVVKSRSRRRLLAERLRGFRNGMPRDES